MNPLAHEVCLYHTSTAIISHGSRGRLAYRSHVGARTFYSEHARNILADRPPGRSYDDGIPAEGSSKKIKHFFPRKALKRVALR